VRGLNRKRREFGCKNRSSGWASAGQGPANGLPEKIWEAGPKRRYSANDRKGKAVERGLNGEKEKTGEDNPEASPVPGKDRPGSGIVSNNSGAESHYFPLGKNKEECTKKKNLEKRRALARKPPVIRKETRRRHSAPHLRIRKQERKS